MNRHGVVCHGAFRRAVLAAVLVLLPVVVAPSLATNASAADGPRSRLAILMGEGDLRAGADSLKVLVPGEGRGEREAGHDANTKLIGTTLFASGLFLCSWGITSWQLEEDQCCPPRNTENALKIIVGVVLLNAGLFYLLGGAD